MLDLLSVRELMIFAVFLERDVCAIRTFWRDDVFVILGRVNSCPKDRRDQPFRLENFWEQTICGRATKRHFYVVSLRLRQKDLAQFPPRQNNFANLLKEFCELYSDFLLVVTSCIRISVSVSCQVCEFVSPPFIGCEFAGWCLPPAARFPGPDENERRGEDVVNCVFPS